MPYGNSGSYLEDLILGASGVGGDTANYRQRMVSSMLLKQGNRDNAVNKKITQVASGLEGLKSAPYVPMALGGIHKGAKEPVGGTTTTDFIKLYDSYPALMDATTIAGTVQSPAKLAGWAAEQVTGNSTTGNNVSKGVLNVITAPQKGLPGGRFGLRPEMTAEQKRVAGNEFYASQLKTNEDRALAKDILAPEFTSDAHWGDVVDTLSNFAGIGLEGAAVKGVVKAAKVASKTVKVVSDVAKMHPVAMKAAGVMAAADILKAHAVSLGHDVASGTRMGTSMFLGMPLGAGGPGGGVRLFGNADKAAMEAANHFAEQANKNVAFTPISAKKINENIAAGKLHVDVTAAQRDAITGGKTQKQGTYVVSADAAKKFMEPLADAPSFNGHIGVNITPSDLEPGVTMSALRAKLALGEHGIISPESLFEHLGAIQISGTSPSIMTAKANSMFTHGAREMQDIATTIFPEFTGKFKAEPIKQSSASEQIDLLTQARGIPAIGSGRVYDTAGNEIKSLSKTLWSANDHASAKAREASGQAIEQVIAKALNIKLPDEFLHARQARLNMVNDPNFNNVLVDFMGNSGKGGVNLKGFRGFLVKQLEKPDLTNHQRGAYQQLLGDVLQGRYNNIGKQLDILDKQVDNPLTKHVDSDFISKSGDYVDSIRKKIRNTPGLSPEQQKEMQTAELKKLSDAVSDVSKRSKNRKITWDDVINRIKETNNVSLIN